MSKKEKIFPLNTFGGRMQDLRKNRLKISRPEFYDLIYPNGNVANESKSRTVKNWESEYCEPDLKTIEKICIVLKCSSDYLLGLDNCTTKDTQFIHDETGLSETAINKLQEIKMYNDAILNNPALPFISILLEQLDSIHYNDILHEIAAYLRSDGLNEDMWYNIESKSLHYKEYNRGKDFNFPIHAHSEMFDNLLLMDIQERLKNLKRQIKKETNTNTD